MARYNGQRIANYMLTHLTPDTLRKWRGAIRNFKQGWKAYQTFAAKNKKLIRPKRYGRKSKKLHYQRVTAREAGTTNTSSKLITRKTPVQQRKLRKLFRTNPIKIKHVNRFGFQWTDDNGRPNTTTWYSVCHLKFNNIVKYLQERIVNNAQDIGTLASTAVDQTASLVDYGNLPDALIYIGKCTFQYELYNPTNYIMTVYIYDLICRVDTPRQISYNQNAQNTVDSNLGCQPEACMILGSKSLHDDARTTTGQTSMYGWAIADPTKEVAASTSGAPTDSANSVYYNTVGMKPTDYHMFNTIWKVKGLKKIILPPGTSHHHNVVFNPKKVVTNANLFYPHENWHYQNKYGLGGLTQATLFGIEGQVVGQAGVDYENEQVGTLPGRMIIKCVRKVNVWNLTVNAQAVISKNNLYDVTRPVLFTNLEAADASSTMQE